MKEEDNSSEIKYDSIPTENMLKSTDSNQIVYLTDEHSFLQNNKQHYLLKAVIPFVF